MRPCGPCRPSQRFTPACRGLHCPQAPKPNKSARLRLAGAFSPKAQSKSKSGAPRLGFDPKRGVAALIEETPNDERLRARG